MSDFLVFGVSFTISRIDAARPCQDKHRIFQTPYKKFHFAVKMAAKDNQDERLSNNGNEYRDEGIVAFRLQHIVVVYSCARAMPAPRL